MLKIIALVSMILDHIGDVFYPDVEWLRILGRLAMPIFAYSVARGFHYTRNRKRYLVQLSILAVVSQGPFMLLFGKGWDLNIAVPWALAVVALMCPVWFAPIFVFVPALVGVKMDYTSVVVALPVVIYYLWFKNRKPVLALLSILVVLSFLSAFSFWVQWFSLLAVPIIYFLEKYDGKVKLNKWVYYYFYPVHMMILWSVKVLV